ncbi:hypothetical protein [Pseudoduganella namucuonensis]|uniref:Uncharacterized protein n=1 Tax=Pseudoduganella namucuonensis TaxID=1035707 RepID=A0A1I7GW24_9BURK|nr:hypothetical protein [Pseudoduganella namucuonensis]SFU52630.1 hypothetical protein SAMN05216552_1004153 [Pseudoduganella namucuonensis]
MLEKHIKVGAPSFLPYERFSGMGNGALVECEGTTKAFAFGSFKFLPFLPNAIHTVAAAGVDVISAPFSGCLMAAYTDESGRRMVCHISTGGEFGDCKAAWNDMKGRFTNVVEFRPSDLCGDTKFETCYGLITQESGCYAVLVQAQNATLPSNSGGVYKTDAKFVKLAKA